MTATLNLPEGLSFTLPKGLEAAEPPEERGLARDEVRLLVAGETLTDRTFLDLPEVLEPGDLLVVNTSATLPAAVPADGGNLLVHLGTQLPGGLWLVELRLPAGAGSLPYPNGRSGQHLALPDGGAADLLAPYPIATGAPSRSWGFGPRRCRRVGVPARLWYAALHVGEDLHLYLGRHGHPIRYGYARHAWPLAAYQTVYADEPGSAEMPSAGRAFSGRVLDSLSRRGIEIARLVLHTGVSSQEDNEPPYPERYRVPAATADRVNAARSSGHRVIAVGTTVARALESVADESGRAHPGAGWTDLVITPQRGVRVISGILSGWHPPGASHLALLEAIAGPDLLARSYHHALSEGYRWHEFGDLHLVLP